MFNISDPMDQRLQAMDIVDYLQEMKERIKEIRNRPNVDSAYEECDKLSEHIKNRIVKEFNLSWEDFNLKIGKSLQQDTGKLAKYKYSKSNKVKSEKIKEFIEDCVYELSRIINSVKTENENPSPESS